MFDHIPAYPGDPILSLNEDFQLDPRPNKVNLSIGIYFDDAGKLPVIDAVRRAETALLDAIGPRSYLPMAGLPLYRDTAQALVFGANHAAREAGRIATLQTLGGSGALKVGADFLKRYFPGSQMWISDPSWENHRVVFEAAGLTVNTYPYYDPQTGGLRFAEMLAAIDTLPEKSVVLLHACCHNPTGVDLSPAQWAELVPVLQRRKLIAFVDMAYQGFGAGLEEDAACVRLLADADVPLIVANSFSKNFSLYGERCGALSVVCRSADEAARVLGQLMAAVRANYSNPPTHGARLVANVLADAQLRASWEAELGAMRERILAMRNTIYAGLEGRVDDVMRTRYVAQRGMFTYTGLSESQVERLRNEYAVYVLRSGRMCVAGLNARNAEYVASSIAAVVSGA
ncbi:aspartate/tyrosine/aromatic aminotransferase [Paraburkholderia sp. Ac-20336]|uniref:amino acid aminotransferase n=1 Tax=Burkholderiaceae TaxID=119060 RepID=UPI0014248FFB|nr:MULTISPECIES: amino acid aminotransferase [Burkholderiaceae]MBN3807284.1 aspartate/tyrosine/aromatic aminotransferase [Paraburkholderia sp. Ac-20336]MBN3847867.1 aspartate/tyrosine/aromatic aminotransferase [Paraburkholderia sp. Ac-20342]NIF52968.1 aspartate/tyrosine/aromatic aminotransferase [Burkholderia sp. Ax-1724]NIF76318.1 aspartate/tyrosine/aromatic aminotransferase [Paraburkholderia sp. Cy-641]